MDVQKIKVGNPSELPTHCNLFINDNQVYLFKEVKAVII